MSTQSENTPPTITIDLEEENVLFRIESSEGAGDAITGVKRYLVFDASDGVGKRRYTAEGILALEKALLAEGLKNHSRVESDRDVLWHTVSEAYDMLEGGREQDAIALLWESLVSCSPKRIEDYPGQPGPITPASVCAALNFVGDPQMGGSPGGSGEVLHAPHTPDLKSFKEPND